MAVSATLIDELARQYLTAEQSSTAIDPIRTNHPDLTEADAYRIQQAILDLKLQQGNTIIGKKAGATNQPSLDKFGLAEPFVGHLLKRNQVDTGGTIALSDLVDPRLECEITFVMSKDLAGADVTPADVLDATEAVLASFEIADSRTKGWAMGMPEIISDSAMAGRYVLGSERVAVAGLDLPSVTVVLTKNGETIAEAQGAAVMGDPAVTVALVARKLGLQAGDIVMAGSLTPPQPVAPGDELEATFSGIGSVAVKFV